MKLGDMAAAVGKGLFAGAAGPPQCHSQDDPSHIGTGRGVRRRKRGRS